MKKRVLLLAAAVAIAQQANAGIVIDIVESGGNVEVDISGDMNLAALTDFFGTFGAFNGFLAAGGNIATSGQVETYHLPGVSWTPFGAGGFGNWDQTTGDAISMYSDPALGLPLFYTSGSPIAATATKFGSSFAALGFVIGTYVTVLDNPATGAVDTVTVNVLPAPGALALLGLGALVGTRRRRSSDRQSVR